jgi:hypothetical protein
VEEGVEVEREGGDRHGARSVLKRLARARGTRADFGACEVSAGRQLECRLFAPALAMVPASFLEPGLGRRAQATGGDEPTTFVRENGRGCQRASRTQPTGGETGARPKGGGPGVGIQGEVRR